jgi:mono/diheme cytochrome c family protein
MKALFLAAIAATPALAQQPARSGAEIFSSVCAACHEAKGEGVVGIAPPLAQNLKDALAKAEGRAYVAQVLAHGLSGKIETQGQILIGAMPAQGDFSDAELAAVANYLAQDLNGAPTPLFVASDFAAARATHVSHKELRRQRRLLLK